MRRARRHLGAGGVRWAGVLLLVATIACALAADASADAIASQSVGSVTFDVVPKNGPDGDHIVNVSFTREFGSVPGEDVIFEGENQPISAASSCSQHFPLAGADCAHSTGNPITVLMTMGDGNDTVMVNDSAGFQSTGCNVTIGTTDVIALKVVLSFGNDTILFPLQYAQFDFSPDCTPGNRLANVTIDAGPGDDTITSHQTSGGGPSVGPRSSMRGGEGSGDGHVLGRQYSGRAGGRPDRCGDGEGHGRRRGR